MKQNVKKTVRLLEMLPLLHINICQCAHIDVDVADVSNSIYSVCKYYDQFSIGNHILLATVFAYLGAHLV